MDDRRREPRVSATGKVSLCLDYSGHKEIEGALVDVSESGFRALHNHVSLSRGTIVRFRHHLKTGRARVVWNRILDDDDEVESGFSILAGEADGEPSEKDANAVDLRLSKDYGG